LPRLDPVHYHGAAFLDHPNSRKMNRHSFVRTAQWAAAASLLIACSAGAAPRHAAPKHAAPAKEAAAPKETRPKDTNDFPTQARVEYVMQCMAEHGGQNLDNMYHCVCAIDKIASKMRFQEYSEALTFTYMFDTPGEKGGEFRDPPKSKELRDKLKEAKKEAEGCFPESPGKAEGEKEKK
jgi:hypothetical protein